MKTEISDLAIFGKPPAFNEKLHVGRPYIGNRERLMERMNAMLDARWLTNRGPFVTEFERKICEITGAKHSVAVCNATIGLEIAIRAANLQGEVIIPSFTFIATAHALQWQGITPVFCDIDPKTHNIDPNKVEALITPKTSGIIGVHVWGRPCDIKALTEICERYNLKLLFDAAHAFGCSYEGTMIGNFGSAEVFSFHGTKFINTFEGGAIVTNEDTLAIKARLMKNFGFVDYDQVVYLGTNGKMDEASAIMGLTSLESMDEFVAINCRNYYHYRQALAHIPGIELISYNEAEHNNYQYIIVEVDEKVTGVTRDQLVEILHAESILARRYFYPGCHQMEPYRSYFPHAGLLLQETEKLASRVMSLPTGPVISTEDIDTICQIISLVVSWGRENRSDLSSQLSNWAGMQARLAHV